MTRNANVSVQNNFVQGLITEATTLNFPQNACTSSQNVVFSRIGDVTRRLGFDFESNNSTSTGNNVQGDVINTFLWKSPAGIGNQNIVVVQEGNLINFYVQVAGSPLSSGLATTSINLDTMSVYNWGTAVGPGYNVPAGQSTIWSTNSTSIVTTGSVTWTIQAGLPVQIGQTVVAMGAGGMTNTMTGVVSTYNVGTGSITLTISSGTGSGTIAYWTFAATALANSTQTAECQFAAGNGYLFVAHEFCNPFFITYNPSGSPAFTATSIPLRTRDFKGDINDTVTSVTQRPTTLTSNHRYNLANQGWTSGWFSGSTSSVTPSTGSSSTFTLTATNPLPIQVGDRVRAVGNKVPNTLPVGAYSATVPSNQAIGTTTAYSYVAGTGWRLTLNVDTVLGSPTLASWAIFAEPNYIDWWNWSFLTTTTGTSSFPSNADMWEYYNLPPTAVTSTNTAGVLGVFDPAATVAQSTPLSTQAPQGHFILDPFFEDRNTASGQTGLTVYSTVAERPQSVAFYEGRVWYSGTNSQGFNARIFFSQIVLPNNVAGLPNYANCYQQEDPTNPEFFNLLPSDGGVVDIIDAGTVYKMMPVLNSLVVFASNGVWAITGSQGSGFKATDYAINKISSVYQISGTSFVDVDGMPYWWNFEGIYRINLNPTSNAMRVESISLTTIKSFMDNIPEESLTYARGSFDPEAKIVQWLFKSVNSHDTYDRYCFDSVLNFNTLSNAFYSWTLNTHVNVNGVISLPANIGTYVTNNVIDGVGDSVVSTTSGTPQVVTLDAVANSTSFAFFYLCSYGLEANLSITFANNLSTTYLDWFSLDSVGQNYTSNFITGWMIKGATQSRWQTNYVRMWTNPANTSVFSVNSIWNYNTTTGSVLHPQTVTVAANTKPRRFKLRGNGLITQFQVTSVAAQPFDIQGWSVFETTSQWV